MSREYEASAVSVRDVRSAYDALYEDLGVEARIVVFVRRSAAEPATLSLVAQACSSSGAPAQGVPAHSIGWPTNRYKTLTQACWHLLYQLYGSVEYMREQAAQVAPERGKDA